MNAFHYHKNAAELTRLRSHILWLKEMDVTGLQQTLRDLHQAFEKFFRGESGYPKTRSHKDDHYRVCGKASFSIDKDWVRLPKLGWVRFRKSREMPKGRVMNVSISRHGPHWFASFCVEHEISIKDVADREAIGIDLGVVKSMTFSDDTSPFHMPVPTRFEYRLLRRIHRQISRKVPDSNRRQKAIDRFGRLSRHHARRILDAGHKITSNLVSRYGEIHIERLDIKEMTKSAKGTIKIPGKKVKIIARFNRALLAQGHSQTIALLAYKCKRTGVKLVLKDPRHTSQECAECHCISADNRLSQEVFKCVSCGHADDADHNAARVVLMRPTGGLSVTARRGNRKTTGNGCRPNEARTQPRDQVVILGSTGISDTGENPIAERRSSPNLLRLVLDR